MDNKFGTNKEIAEMFGVHESYLYKLHRQRHETGDLSPLPHGGGAPQARRRGFERFKKLIEAQPDALLEELQQHLKQKAKREVSLTTVWRGKLKMTVKKDALPQ